MDNPTCDYRAFKSFGRNPLKSIYVPSENDKEYKRLMSMGVYPMHMVANGEALLGYLHYEDGTYEGSTIPPQ